MIINELQLLQMQKTRLFRKKSSCLKKLGLKEGASTLLTIQKSLSKNGISLKVGSGETAEIGYANRPIIEVIAGQPVVRQQVKSLGSVARENAETRAWEYAVDKKLNPTMNIGNRLIVWNPATRYAISDGEWSYDIKPDENPRYNAAIGRSNGSGEKEFWHRDRSKGEEIVQGIDGTKKITTWFTSGKLAGKVRKVEEVQGNAVKVIRQLSYNEEGRLAREVGPDGRVEIFTYDGEGKRFSSSNPMPTPEELDRIEQNWKTIIESSTADISKKQDALYELALFYIGRRYNSAKARELAQLINSPQRRFNVILQSYDHDRSLSAAEKISSYQQLLQEFPDKQGVIGELIKLRKGEI